MKQVKLLEKKNSETLSEYLNIKNNKYIPPTSKEWKNNAYLFNLNNTRNFPMADIIIDKLITGYFNSCFLINKYTPDRKKFKFSRVNKGYKKIYTSKSELNHKNSKVIVSFYVYNVQKHLLLKKIKNQFLHHNKLIYSLLLSTILLLKNVNWIKEIKIKNFKVFNKLLITTEKYKLMVSLNQYKFEEKFLYTLAKSLAKLYKKKIEFNIFNLKSLSQNSDIFTKILSLKLKSKKINPHKYMKFILNKAFILKSNSILEKSPVIKDKFFREKISRFKLSFNLKVKMNEYLTKFCNFSTNSNTIQLYETISNAINYKNIGGIRLEVKGRLTRRYRADRAVFKARWKGGLRNIDSSYKKLPSILKRNHCEYNINTSFFAGKRHVGAFAAKGWVSGK